MNDIYIYWVEYNEVGYGECADSWSERTLREELNRNEVEITYVCRVADLGVDETNILDEVKAMYIRQ